MPGSVPAGTRVGRYEIVSLLGRGGMGEVYSATDSNLGRQVALKILPSHRTSDLDRVARFVREARASSALNHPSIVAVHDAGSEGDVHYLAMELIDGEPLSIWMKKSRGLSRIIELMAQVAEGLARAHAHGIVHRDLKPDNSSISIRRWTRFPKRSADYPASPDDFEWISLVTANHGVTTGTTSGERAAAYGAAIRTQLGAKNGFPVFSPYNPDWAPKYHTNFLSAYAVLGTYVNLLYENVDYPLEQTGWVFAHEMGHVFWACDEYQAQCQRFMDPPCSNCYGTFSGDPEAAENGPGPREASMNWNCELCTPNGPDACLMHATTSSNWSNRSTCIPGE